MFVCLCCIDSVLRQKDNRNYSGLSGHPHLLQEPGSSALRQDSALSRSTMACKTLIIANIQQLHPPAQNQRIQGDQEVLLVPNLLGIFLLLTK